MIGAWLASLTFAAAPGPTETSTASPALIGVARDLFVGLHFCVRDLARCEAERQGDARKLLLRTATIAADRATPIVLPAEEEDRGASTLRWILAIIVAAAAGGVAGAYLAD